MIMGLKYLKLQIYITSVHKGKNYGIHKFGFLLLFLLYLNPNIFKLELEE